MGVFGSTVRIKIESFHEPITIFCQTQQQAQRTCIELAQLFQHLKEKIESELTWRYKARAAWYRLTHRSSMQGTASGVSKPTYIQPDKTEVVKNGHGSN